MYPEMPVWLATTDAPQPIEEIVVTRFGYEPRVVSRASKQKGWMTATVYVPAHLSEDAQWELVKALGLGEVPEG